ncbi:hypothetical protein [Actinokineospora enzanensis]|uniref:hypothetical protein n=1 Tax=Actinokineospora enzanensis TaxID=155975 RepID=UPI00036BF8B2|nr:hypothetical protein [Actinokineospora enzanensis]
MNGTVAILTLWVLASSGIQLGTLWIMKTSILPMLNSLPYDRYVTVCQLIDMHVFHPIAVWNGVIAAGLGVWAAFLVPSPAVAVLFVVGSVGMVVVGLTSEGFNRPIWRQIEKWSPQRVAADWGRKRSRWYIAHEVRTYGAIAAVGAYIAAFAGQIA